MTTLMTLIEKPRVLHVDDDEDFLVLFSRVFGEWFTITSVNSGAAAIEKLQTKRYDAVITDYDMPEMDGLELLKAIREDDRKIPVIIKTGQGNEEVAREAFILGVSDYFIKDISSFAQKEKVINSIRKAIEIRLSDEAKRKAEEALKKKQEELQTILDSAPAMIFYKDKANRFIRINKAAIEEIGLPREEIEGRTAFEIFPEHAEDYWRDDREVMASGRPKRNIIEPFKTAGGIKWFQTDKIPSLDEKGNINGIIAFAVDITKRKQMEESLRKSEEKYRDLVESTQDLIFACDIDGRITFANAAFERILGRKTDEFVGARLIEHVKSEDREYFLDSLTRKIEAGKSSISFETRMQSHNEGTRIIRFNCNPLKNDEGNVIGFMGTGRDITERRRAQEALRRQRDLAEGLIEISPVIILLLDTRGRIVRFNPYMEEISGYSLKEVRGKNWFTTFLPERDWNRMRALFLKAKGDIRTRGNINFIVTRDGREREIEWYDISIKDADSTIIGLLCIGQDITERKKAEEKIRKLSSAVLQSVDGIGIYDIKQRLEYVNRAFAAMHGYSPEEMIGIKIKQLHNDEQVKEFKKRINEIKTKGRWEGETGHIKGDGISFPVFVSMTLLKDEKGNPTGMLEICRDITESRKAEKALRESEERYRRISEAVTDYIFTVHIENGRPVRTVHSHTCVAVTGYSPDNFADDPSLWIRMVPPKDRGAVLKQASRVLSGQDLAPLEHRIMRRDGATRWIRNTPVPHYDPQGKLLSYDGLIRDITERKEAEAKLRESREQLRNLSTYLQSVREKERTHIAMEIHDELGQTLTALKFDLSWLFKKMPDKKEIFAQKIQSMLELVDSTIRMVQRISTELRPGILDDLGISAAIEWQTNRLEERFGIQCDFSSIPEDIILDTERSTAIFRISQETLTNIARHAGAIRAHVLLKKESDVLTLMIQDNGRGISMEQLSEPFSFGLLGMRERVHFLGGTIEFEGKSGKGTSVTVKIPLK